MLRVRAQLAFTSFELKSCVVKNGVGTDSLDSPAEASLRDSHDLVSCLRAPSCEGMWEARRGVRAPPAIQCFRAWVVATIG